jgi:hypothetical protein
VPVAAAQALAAGPLPQVVDAQRLVQRLKFVVVEAGSVGLGEPGVTLGCPALFGQRISG